MALQSIFNSFLGIFLSVVVDKPECNTAGFGKIVDLRVGHRIRMAVGIRISLVIVNTPVVCQYDCAYNRTDQCSGGGWTVRKLYRTSSDGLSRTAGTFLL